MDYAKLCGCGMLTLILTSNGCSQSASPPPADTKKETVVEQHTHGTGPNGGVVFDLGKYHVEFTVDHNKKECTILALSSDGKSSMPIAAKELTLTTKETKTADGTVVAPMTVKLLPKDEADGKAAKFVGTDPDIGNVADFAGTVLGEIDGKPSQGEFQE